jgi:hypothetical protein
LWRIGTFAITSQRGGGADGAQDRVGGDSGTQRASTPFEVLAFEDKIITMVPGADGLNIRSFVGRALAEPEPGMVLDVGTTTDPRVLIGRDGTPDHDPVSAVSSFAATLVRGSVVIATMNRRSVKTWSYDAASATIVSGPQVIGPTRFHEGLGIGGDDQGGSAGICFAAGDAPYDSDLLQFALVAPDGTPRGEPITIAQRLRYAAACDVASGHADEHLVALWNAGNISPPSGMLAARVHVPRADRIIE